MSSMSAPVPTSVPSGSRVPRPEDMALFEGLVVSDPPKRKGGLWVPASVTGHILIVAGLVLIPILWPSSNPEIGDLRVTVMASIMVMDELSEAQRRIGELERQMEALRQHGDNAAAVAEKSDQALAGMIAELSSQVRSIADKLNGTGGTDTAS